MADTMLKLTYADGHVGVRRDDLEILFSYQSGGPVSLVKGGKEWLYRAIRPAFWRALTDNDRGNSFHLKSGMWLSADAYIRVKEVRVYPDDQEIPLPIAPYNNRFTGKETAEKFRISYVLETITVPATEVTVSYTVFSDGHILTEAHYEGKKGLPELPVFGLRMIMPTAATGYTYEGLSGETYPDRKDGGIKGVHEIKGMPMPGYLTPQECGMHMDTEWLLVKRDTTLNNADRNERSFSLRIEKNDRPFAFSCLPYTPMELECATHAEELPPKRRTVLTICGAVRGVGGIDSWGSDVEAPYHISGEENIDFSFVIG